MRNVCGRGLRLPSPAALPLVPSERPRATDRSQAGDMRERCLWNRIWTRSPSLLLPPAGSNTSDGPTAIRRPTCRKQTFLLLAPEHDMRREVCGSGFYHAVAEGREIQALEHRLAPSEQDRRKRKMQFIDQAGLQVLSNGRDAATDLDVTCSRGGVCALERGMNPVRDEVERGAALHYDRLAGMVRQDKRRSVIRRIVSPPALPAIVQPFPAHRAEHVPAKDEGTEAVHRAVGKGLVHALRATALAEHGLECLRSEKPAVKLHPALSQRILETLFRTGSEPI